MDERSRKGRRRPKPGPAEAGSSAGPGPELCAGKARFVVLGLEAAVKKVKDSHGCGRIYLPYSWLGKRVKIIRLD